MPRHSPCSFLYHFWLITRTSAAYLVVLPFVLGFMTGVHQWWTLKKIKQFQMSVLQCFGISLAIYCLNLGLFFYFCAVIKRCYIFRFKSSITRVLQCNKWRNISTYITFELNQMWISRIKFGEHFCISTSKNQLTAQTCLILFLIIQDMHVGRTKISKIQS